jgi:cell division protein FtsL
VRGRESEARRKRAAGVSTAGGLVAARTSRCKEFPMARLNLILLAALVVCALSVVTSQHTARKLYVELQKEQELAKRLDVEWGQLQLEQSTWAMHARVEKIASHSLMMRLPPASRVQMVAPEPAQ